MSDIFIPELAFQEFVETWSPKSRKLHERKHDKQAFLKHITSQEEYDRLVQMAAAQDDRMRLGPWLDSVFKSKSPEITATQGLITDPQQIPKVIFKQNTWAETLKVAVSTGTDPAIEDAFSRIWNAWPKNEKSGKRSTARSAFAEACRSRGLEQIVKICDFYVLKFADPRSGLVHPNNLANFLGDDEKLDSWLQRTESMLPPDEAADFEAVYSHYLRWPTKNHQTSQEDAAVFWKRHVLPQDRLLFYLFVRVYGSMRQDKVKSNPEEAAYTKGFNGFVTDWKTSTDENLIEDVARLGCTLLERAISDVVIVEGLGGTKRFREDRTSFDSRQSGLWNYMFQCLAWWEKKNNLKGAVLSYLSMIPMWAANEGRSCPKSEALRDIDNVCRPLQARIMEGARLLTHQPQSSWDKLPTNMPDLWPQDPAWVAQQKAEKERLAEEERLTYIKNQRRAVMEKDERRERAVSRQISSEAIDALNSLPMPYRQMAWHFATEIHWMFIANKVTPYHSVAVFQFLIDRAAEDCKRSKMDPEYHEYINILRGKLDTLPPDPVPKEVKFDGPIVLNFKLKVQDDEDKEIKDLPSDQERDTLDQ